MINSISRADYKAIKHMSREEMTNYMVRVYRRGYEKGLIDAKKTNDDNSSNENKDIRA